MSDKLRDHIEDNRTEFDVYAFDSAKGWDEIATAFKKEKKWPLWKKMSVAACLTFIIVATIFQATPLHSPESSISEIETYYQSEIDYKVSLVKSMLDDHRILEDLEAMDQAFSELKADLKDNVDNEEVVMAMLENYRLKLQILEEILSELEKEQRASI